MNIKNYFSIGQIAKLTNTNFNSLKYYERIGLLHPAYINPQNGYRYYSFSQFHIVEAIKFCVMLEIPLNRLSAYLVEDGQNIQYTKLIEYGTTLAEKKIEEIKYRLQYLTRLEQDINRSELCNRSTEPQISSFLGRALWITAFQGGLNSAAYYRLLKDMMAEIHDQKLNGGYDYGLIMFRNGNNADQYIYIEIEGFPEKSIDSLKNIICLPTADYLCISTKTSGLIQDFNKYPEFIKNASESIIIERELLLGDYRLHSPAFELQFLLPADKALKGASGRASICGREDAV